MVHGDKQSVHASLFAVVAIEVVCGALSFAGGLTPEVVTAVEENQRTYDWVKTIQATVKTVGNYRRETGSRTMRTVEDVWYDKDHVRIDKRESEFIGEDTSRLFIRENGPGKMLYFAPFSPGSLHIHSVESHTYFYQHFAYILPPRLDERSRRCENPALAYQLLADYTLKEKVLENAKLGYFFTAQADRVNGEECILLSCDFDNKMGSRFWVVPSKGYCIKKMQAMFKGKIYDEYEMTLREYAPGHWWFDSAKVKRWKGDEEEPYEDFQVFIESLKFNEPIDPKAFTIAGTHIPPGTVIVDKITGLTYVYGQPLTFATNIDLALDALKDAMGEDADSAADANGDSKVARATNAGDGNASDETATRPPASPLGRHMTAMERVLLGAGTGACLLLLLWGVHAKGARKR